MTTNQKLVTAAAALFAALTLAFGAVSVVLLRSWLAYRTSDAWMRVPARVVACQAHDGEHGMSYTVTYAYEVAGAPHQGTRYSFDDRLARSSYTPGAAPSRWVDPADAEHAVLAREMNPIAPWVCLAAAALGASGLVRFLLVRLGAAPLRMGFDERPRCYDEM